MQTQQKKRMLQKLWGWICLSINCLVVALHLTGQRAELLGSGIFFSVMPVCYGVIKTQMDKRKGDTSVIIVAIEYVCVYIITFLLGFKMASYLSSVSVMIALLIASVAEMLVFLLITYWHTIRRFFLQKTEQNR